MNDSTSGPDLLNELAYEFAGHFRPGERPSLTEYTGKLETELNVDGRSLIGFSPNGRRLVTTAGEPRLWAAGSWAEGPQIGGGDFAFSPDGTLLAAETGHGAVRLVDPNTGREYARLENPNQERASMLTFGSDGTRIVTTDGHHRSLHVWDLRAVRKQLAEMGLDWALSPDAPASEVDETQPLRIEVLLGDPAQLLRDREAATRKTIEQKRRAVEANPNNALACNDLAWTHLTAPAALRDWKAALPLAQKAVQLNPDPMNRNTLGLAYYRAGRFREAVTTLEPNLKDHVDWALPFDLYVLAMSHHHLGECPGARQFHDLAVRSSGAHGEAPKPYVVDLVAIQAEAAELLAVKDKKQ
jgi:hypothetical protein